MTHVQICYRDDAPVTDATASFGDFVAGSNAAAVRIEPGEDVRALLSHLGQISLVEVNFPAFGDGRGFSSAQILREAGYTGELRATGDVLVDQLVFLRRCGFDSFAPDKPLNLDDVEAAMSFFPEFYQNTSDGVAAIWAKRHQVAS
ncbi:DUF934 domain-containing protein [Blastomonas aquatica]|uniref:Oxidoreductase n=1 Tax=Blastomonas aquatica TaxID=1510276 RepID=A0ABQ1ITM7_9SPHN|nr:DUF934 domain-containing protein [Blastomonas aquatica]GGB50906.1 hypothetical protein GCM10010833_02020 [Blastomonas aquatica]